MHVDELPGRCLAWHPVSDPIVDEAMVQWASDEASHRLEPLAERWRHVRGVATRARQVAPILDPEEGRCLVAAAYLHDIGWAPALVDTGFHPIDGASYPRFVQTRVRLRVGEEPPYL